MNIPLWDSHLHTPLCKHAKGHPREYAQAALDAGLSGLVFTDHMPMPAWFDAPWRMHEQELPRYIEMVQEAQSEFAGRLEIRLGLEADYHPGTERYVERILAAHPWDYVIGSVHYLGAWGFDNPDFQAEYQARPLDEIYQMYYQLVYQAVHTGLFDSIGHLDLPKKFGHKQPEYELEWAAECLEAVHLAEMALDYNTAGLRKPIAEVYPSWSLSEQAIALGIPLVLGSDAHAPVEVGYQLAAEAARLQAAGAKLVRYQQREVISLLAPAQDV